MVDDAEFVGGNDDQVGVEFARQVQNRKSFTKGREKAAGAFDDHVLVLLLVLADEREDTVEGDFAAMFASGNQWRERFRKEVGINFVEGQGVILHGTEMPRIGARPGTEWFQRNRIDAASTQGKHHQTGQDGFTDTGVSAADDGDIRAYCQFMFSTWMSRGELRRSSAV